MGFGGGGGAGPLAAHVHNNVPLQGGPLDFANDTIASLNAGSTTFSDGAALQELVIGNAGETLTVNGGGTAPEWAAGGGGGGNYEFVESFTLGGSASTFTCTFANPISVSGISEIVAIFSGSYAIWPASAGLEMQVRTNSETPITSATYSWGYLNLMDATSTTGVDVDHFLVGANTTAAGSNSTITMHISHNSTLAHRLNCSWNMAGTNVVATTGGGFTYQSSGDITSFDGILLTSSADNIEVGSTVDIYKVTV